MLIDNNNYKLRSLISPKFWSQFTHDIIHEPEQPTTLFIDKNNTNFSFAKNLIMVD